MTHVTCEKFDDMNSKFRLTLVGGDRTYIKTTTLPKTNISPEKIDGWKIKVSFWNGSFLGECTSPPGRPQNLRGFHPYFFKHSKIYPQKLTWLAGKSTMNEDVCPIKNWDFPASHVSFQGCNALGVMINPIWLEDIC